MPFLTSPPPPAATVVPPTSPPPDFAAAGGSAFGGGGGGGVRTVAAAARTATPTSSDRTPAPLVAVAAVAAAAAAPMATAATVAPAAAAADATAHDSPRRGRARRAQPRALRCRRRDLLRHASAGVSMRMRGKSEDEGRTAATGGCAQSWSWGGGASLVERPWVGETGAEGGVGEGGPRAAKRTRRAAPNEPGARPHGWHLPSLAVDMDTAAVRAALHLSHRRGAATRRAHVGARAQWRRWQRRVVAIAAAVGRADR